MGLIDRTHLGYADGETTDTRLSGITKGRGEATRIEGSKDGADKAIGLSTAGGIGSTAGRMSNGTWAVA